MSGKSHSEIQGALQAAVTASMKDKDKDEDFYCYVQDFDDNTVTYYLSGETFQATYAYGDDGTVVLGDPQKVRPVTTYVPTGDQKAMPTFETRGMPGPMWPPRIEVTSEPLTYQRYDMRHSWVADTVKVTMNGDNDGAATTRLQRHRAEMAIEIPKLEARQARAARAADQPDGTTFEKRANPSRLQGQGGYFAPPLWVNNLFVTAPRPRRVLADLARHFDLPAGVSSINLPRITTGTTAGNQVDNMPAPSADFADAQVNSAVSTVSGISDVSLQLLEQSPPGASLDDVVFMDMCEASDAAFELLLMSGTGGTGFGAPPLGILNVPSIISITYTTGAPTIGLLYPLLGQAFGAVSNARKHRPEAWLMRGGRWAYMASALDAGASRPLVVPGIEAPIDRVGGPNPIGNLLGVGVFTTESLPASQGVAANQDVIVALRPQDCIVWESPFTMAVQSEVLSGTLGCRLRIHRYVAAMTGRLPSSVAVIAGTGMVVTTNL